MRQTRRKRVLVIDDDETFRYVFRQMIGSEPEYDVIEADGAEQGLKRVREQRPDLILLDLQMPQFDGFFVLRELESNRALKTIPVVIATSLPITPQLRERIPAGMYILSKADISRDKVLMIVREATERNLAI